MVLFTDIKLTAIALVLAIAATIGAQAGKSVTVPNPLDPSSLFQSIVK